MSDRGEILRLRGVADTACTARTWGPTTGLAGLDDGNVAARPEEAAAGL